MHVPFQVNETDLQVAVQHAALTFFERGARQDDGLASGELVSEHLVQALQPGGRGPRRSVAGLGHFLDIDLQVKFIPVKKPPAQGAAQLRPHCALAAAGYPHHKYRVRTLDLTFLRRQCTSGSDLGLRGLGPYS